MKEKLQSVFRRVVPHRARNWIWIHVRSRLNLVTVLYYEFERYSRWSLSTKAQRSDRAREKDIILLTHILQKGFTHSPIRSFFGLDVVELLLMKVSECLSHTPSHFFLDEAVSTLRHYQAHHKDVTDPPSERARVLLESLDAMLARCPPSLGVSNKGTITVSLASLMNAAEQGGVALIQHRHSIRVFDRRQVERRDVEVAVRNAQRSPSACNLQPVSVRACDVPETVERIIRLQMGAQSFAKEVGLVLVITAELGLASGPRSLHQGYVDGGIFASTLMLTLLEKGIGSCPLHWAMMPSQDRQLRRWLNIPDSETIVMLIAAGYVRPSCEVAFSGRRPLEQVLLWTGAPT